MSTYGHKVLLAIHNPFIKKRPHELTGRLLLWLTRDDYDDGRKMPAKKYLLLIYGFNGRIKHHFELIRFDRKKQS